MYSRSIGVARNEAKKWAISYPDGGHKYYKERKVIAGYNLSWAYLEILGTSW